MMRKFRRFAVIIFITILVIYSIKVPVAKEKNMKYILQWSNPKADPFCLMGSGREQFLERRCAYNNCIITPYAWSLSCITDFDAILFHGPEFCQKNVEFPTERSPYQKYILVSRESPLYYPLTSPRYNEMFNWTFTYKLDSDIYFGFVVIKNREGEVVGPKIDMNWMDVAHMKEVDDNFKSKLKSKRIAAAWFVSNCNARSQRENIALQLQKELAKYWLVLDIYSETCKWKNIKSCPKDPTMNVAEIECLKKIETDYYFYLAFENSLSEDYVTEKLLNAVQHYAVPIVYGGANYTRFLPNGSYLDVRALGLRRLVYEMIKAISNKERYYGFFKWTNHYSYHRPDKISGADYMCALCSAMNNEDLVKRKSVYKNMIGWWRSHVDTSGKILY